MVAMLTKSPSSRTAAVLALLHRFLAHRQRWALVVIGLLGACGDDSSSEDSTAGAGSTIELVQQELDDAEHQLESLQKKLPAPETSREIITLAERVEEDCAALRVLDPAAYDKHCGTSSARAFARAVRSVHDASYVPPEASADDPKAIDPRGPGAGRPVDPLPPPAELSSDLRTSIVALEEDVEAATRRIAYAHYTLDRIAFIEAEAHLTSLADALRGSATRAGLVPDEPFVLLSQEGRRHAHNFVQDKLRALEFEESIDPKLVGEKAVLEHYRNRIEPLLRDDAATFHLARDGLDEKVLAAAMTELERDREKEKAVLLAVHRDSYGAPFPDGPGPDGSPPSPGTDPKGPRSSRARESLWPSGDRPVEGLKGEAVLQAEYDELRSNGRLTQEVSYGQWRRTLLTERDRGVVLAELYRADLDGPRVAEVYAILREPSPEVVVTSEKFDAVDVETSPEVHAKYFALGHDKYRHLDDMAGRMRNDLTGLVDAALEREARRAKDLVSRAGTVQHDLAAKTSAISGSHQQSVEELRMLIVTYARRLDARMAQLEAVGYEIEPQVRARTIAWRRAFGGGDEPPERAPLLLHDAKLTSLAEQVDAKVVSLEKVSKGLSNDPVPYGNALGRRIVTKAHLKKGRKGLASAPKKVDEPRMPKEFEDYKGRLRPDGKYYDFETQVRKFKTFEAVGGGIHMGGVAKYHDATTLDGALVVYDDGRERLELHLADGRRILLARIDPISIKALYRFVRTGANLAVSIGYSGDAEDSLSSIVSGMQVVLLDPMFVDTPVGQDLVLADDLPWRLDEARLPNGKHNPIAREFAVLEEALDEQAHRRKLREWLESSPKTVDDEAWKPAEKPGLEGRTAIDVLFELLLWERDVQGALSELSEGVEPSELDVFVDLVGGTGVKWSEAAARIAIVNFQLGRIVRRQAQLFHVSIDEGQENHDLSIELIDLMTPTPTVATLIDDLVFMSIDSDPALDVQLRWYYATSKWEQTGDVMAVKRDSDEEGATAAEHLAGMETLVTSHAGTLADEYQPLGRVRRYAGICALLRFVLNPRDDLEIMLDLSSLAAYDASSSTKHPTPDAIAL